MKKILFGMIFLGLLIASPAPAKEGVTPMLNMHTTYHFQFFIPATPVADLPGRVDGTLWAYAWEGPIQGDIDGIIRWWVQLVPPDVVPGVGRWEIWDCEYPAVDCDNPEQLIMAGYDAYGLTSDTEWAGKGVVTFVGAAYQEEYGEWFGHRINDGGWIEFLPGTDPPLPIYGEGWFTIYNTPSNKH